MFRSPPPLSPSSLSLSSLSPPSSSLMINHLKSIVFLPAGSVPHRPREAGAENILVGWELIYWCWSNSSSFLGKVRTKAGNLQRSKMEWSSGQSWGGMMVNLYGQEYEEGEDLISLTGRSRSRRPIDQQSWLVGNIVGRDEIYNWRAWSQYLL